MKTIHQQAIEYYGIDHQKLKLIEEMSELTMALIKYTNIAEEIADVQIVLNQLKLIYPDWQEFEKMKLKRLIERMRNNL